MYDYKKIQKEIYKKKFDIVIVIIILIIAFTVRISYQNNSIVRNHIISDAREYFLGAYNMCFFKTYSTSTPKSPQMPPKPNAGRTPGYSLFLLPFLCINKTINGFLENVMFAQAILGTLVSAIGYLQARLFLPPLWALAIGILTAISPHLVAMDDYLLTESLFTFVLILSFYLLCVGWRFKKRSVLFFSGIGWGYAFLVKPLAMLLGPFVATVLFIDPLRWKLRITVDTIKMTCMFLIGMSLTIAPFFIRNYLVLNKIFPESGRGWASIVDGTYINLTYKNPRFYGYPYKDDPLNPKMHRDKGFFFKTLKERFFERPIDYIKWYLGGKILCAWRWDVVTGHHDVYVYPMRRFGFHSNKILFFIHSAMKFIHWLIFWIAILCPFILFAAYKTGRLPFISQEGVYIMPYILIIIYFFTVATLMFPIPRYFIPIRPYIYTLSIVSLYFMTSIILKNREIIKQEA